jgi:hypothetical protein
MECLQFHREIHSLCELFCGGAMCYVLLQSFSKHGKKKKDFVDRWLEEHLRKFNLFGTSFLPLFIKGLNWHVWSVSFFQSGTLLHTLVR